MTYAEKLRDPRWQKKRLEVLELHNWKCFFCGNTKETLHVHHFKYTGDPWESDPGDLCAVCESCHHIEHLKNKMTPLEICLYSYIMSPCIEGYGSELQDKLLRDAKKKIIENYG